MTSTAPAGIDRSHLMRYEEVIDVVGSIRVILRETRRRKRQTLAEAGEQIGVAASTILRWERGETDRLGVHGIIAVLRWAAT